MRKGTKIVFVTLLLISFLSFGCNSIYADTVPVDYEPSYFITIIGVMFLLILVCVVSLVKAIKLIKKDSNSKEDDINE